jgi:hypothetical protein
MNETKHPPTHKADASKNIQVRSRLEQILQIPRLPNQQKALRHWLRTHFIREAVKLCSLWATMEAVSGKSETAKSV